MTGAVQNLASAGSTNTSALPALSDARATAQTIITETAGKPATYDRLGQIEARLDAIARTDPAFAAQVRAEIMASTRLSASDKGVLSRQEPGHTADVDGKRTIREADDGIPPDVWINRQRSANTPEYQALVKLAGSSANEPIKAVMRELHDRAMTTGQLEVARLNEASAANSELAADLGQMALDIVGIFDPTPASDLVNAGISAWRGDGWGAFLSVVSAVPYVGDLAKLGKLGKWAETVAKSVDAAANNPAARAMLEPALRKVSDLIGALPAKAFDALPADTKASLLAMKGKVDDLLGTAGTKVDDVLPSRPAMVDGRPQHYFDTAGKKGAWNKELNQKLTPNADYHVNGYKFSTDAKGRVASVEGELVMTTAERAKYQQGIAGGADRLPDDQGGHLIASIFNGPGEAVNLKAMNGNFNMGAFRDLERKLADAVASGKKVEVKIDVIHSGDSARPEAFRVQHTIAGNTESQKFRNTAGGK